MKSFILSVLSLCVFLAMLIWISGCTPVIQTKYITTELRRDPPPLLTKINRSEIPNCSAAQPPCIAQQTAQKLLTREQQLIGYIKYLEALIDSTLPEPLNAAQPPNK